MPELDERLLLHGNEAVAQAARDCGVALGIGYPGTPSTEILEHFSSLGGPAQWAPNEKVAMEVAIGAAFGGAWALTTMKHVGVNVAADVLFTAAYTNIAGGLVVISADDPGMASSQNEQDNRRYAEAAGIPMLEPSDSQEAYDMTALAFEISSRWHIPVLLRMTTRICHSKTVVRRKSFPAPPAAHFERDIPGRVMVPAYARKAHRRLREKLAAITAWNEAEGPQREISGDADLGIITSGVSYMHVREAAPDASIFKIGMSYPIPLESLRAFAEKHKRVLVIEEGDPYLEQPLRAAGIAVEGKPEAFRFGELNVERVRRILRKDFSPEPENPAGKPPQLCAGCPHRITFGALSRLNCIVSGDIGCYTLGVLPPFEAMDTCVCMGASIGAGLGLRHVLPPEEARRVVSVIGDSTFVHSGITGLVEMMYSPPETGHVVIILDNSITAMTGMQEHPATGRKLDHTPAPKRLSLETLCTAIGMDRVEVVDPSELGMNGMEKLLADALSRNELTVFIVRKPCVLIEKKLNAMEKKNS